jgi:crotonobetainyl-CoA:carnitine CoA-transferase CaiB-like acyl-CoA transferase
MRLTVQPLALASAATGSLQASPPLGRDTDDVLREGGLSPGEIAALREQGIVA